MSRSPGSSPSTGLPSIRMLPLVGWSRPAIRFKVVDFPQPEGPTSETNSPSAISSDSSCKASGAPGNALRTRSRETLAIGALLLHRAGGQARHDAPLEEEREQRERHGGDDGGGRD